MTDMQFPTTQDLLIQQRFRRNLVMGMLIALIATIFGLMLGISYIAPKLQPPFLLLCGVGLLVCLVVPVLIWNYPRLGLMILFACTTFIDMDPRLQNTHKLTANLPFFLNFNNIGDQFHISGLSPFKFSPAEIIIFLVLFSWLIRGIVKRELHVKGGPFIGVLLFYAFTTGVGYLHGYTTGGDLQMALWEVRAQFYPLIMYFLVVNLLTERKHVEQLLWVAFIGLGVLSVVGVISFFQLGGAVSDQGLLDHEDSLVLNVFVFLLLYLRMNNGNRAMVRVGYVFLPLILFTIMENQRRAGIAAFIIAFIASLPIMWILFVEKRKQLAVFIGVFAVFSSIYLPVAWNGNGAWALPARAIRSNSAPDERDQGSDNYRFMENADLKFTRDISPYIGYGYGKPFVQIYYLPAVTTEFLHYIAHNSVLWIWMRTGHLGFFAFLLFIAVVFIRGLQICQEVRDPILLTAGLMGVIFLLMAFIYGKYDLQLTNYRTMMMLGVWLGVLGALPRLNHKPDNAMDAPEKDSFMGDEFPVVGLPGFMEGRPL